MELISTIEVAGPSMASRDAVTHAPTSADKLIVLSTWMIVLGTVRLLCAIANYAMAALEIWRIGPASSQPWTWFFEANPPIVALIAAWPLLLGLALRRTCWPELLKASALTFFILSVGGVLSMIADWTSPHVKWIDIGSFRIARQALTRLDLSLIVMGMLGAVQLLLELGTAGCATSLAFRTPDQLLVDSDRQVLARRTRLGRMAILISTGFLILMVRLPASTAFVEVLNQSRWLREFLLRDDYRRIQSVRSSTRRGPDTARFQEVNALFYEATRAWNAERYNESWDTYRHLIALTEKIPQSSIVSEGRTSIANAFNGWAWLLATCPEVNLRNLPDAVSYARRAVDLVANEHESWNTLGVAYYRVGNWEEARNALYRAMELNDEGTAFDWFFLAMIHAKFGHKERAREWYDKAVQDGHQRWPGNAELYRFQVEAAEVLGLPKPERIPTPPGSNLSRSPAHSLFPGGIPRRGRGRVSNPHPSEN